MRYFTITLLLFSCTLLAQNQKIDWDSVSFSGVKLRSVGPAFMTGRISDVAIDPNNNSHYYVGVGSGGVWETKNAGTTFTPIFDGQKVYSIGCITIDPSNTNNVWVGTGENVGGRHISFGDGIYLSKNGGISWENKGLKNSEHISKIVIHPTNSNIVWVAVQGPLWSSGGERGIYKTINGGKKWKRVLGDNEWTGATDLLLDPRNPDVLYAATWQRHRTVASYMGGGPKSGIHKSTDGGKTWNKLKTGLPSGNMGKIGLAISPQKPDVLYAAIELDLRKGGVFRSANGGASWSKMSNKVGGGTGPHYYQELYACPHNFDRIYLANNYFLVSDNGGKDFRSVGKKNKHVDNHAMAFRANDPNYLMVGTDGGLYESFDLAESWKHMGNLPITQYYKLAVDNAEPFYNIYGGTQDNNTQGGPSRTDNAGGIDDNLWQVVLGGDGHQPATDPSNNSILYAQSQQGYYKRVDLFTGERVDIRPQPKEGESYERYNWDAPILVSPHDPKQVYVASHRLFKSNNRGDSWSVISSDLTRNEERFNLPIMGKKQSYNSPYDVYAMSTYNTITSISESPVQQDLIYVGSDDGLVHVTEDGGESWNKIDVKSLPGAPERAYVNDIKADLFDANTVYLALDNHKTGDYKPYLYVSSNRGKSWKSISSNLPENNYIWRIVQDHKKSELFFLATEFGLYTSIDAGKRWHQLKGGLPTISFRDLVIQKREDDLVAASFGRSFYILDDISFLRELNKDTLKKEAILFGCRDADLFIQRRNGRAKNGSLGGDYYAGKNPEYGAVITYYVGQKYPTLQGERKKEEKELNKKNKDIDFPGWDVLEKERNESKVVYWVVIKDSKGNVINRFKAPSSKGFHRVAWNLRAFSGLPIRKGADENHYNSRGFLVNEGTFSATLAKTLEGEVEVISGPISFKVNQLYKSTLQPVAAEQRNEYYKDYLNVVGDRSELNYRYNEIKKLSKSIKVSLINTGGDVSQAFEKYNELHKAQQIFDTKTGGYKSKNEVGEKNKPTLNDRIGAAGAPMYGSLHGPTGTSKENLALAKKMLLDLDEDLDAMETSINELLALLKEMNAPSINGAE